VKVLHVFKDYFPPSRGGIEHLIHDIVHSMDGVVSEVLTSSRSRRLVEDDDDGVRVVRAPEYARPTSTPVTPAWAKHMRDTDADVIHFHMPNPFGELMLLASRTTVPVVASYHADIVGRRAVLPFYLPFHHRALRRAERIVVASPPMREAPQMQPHADRTVVIPYGVEPGEWERRPSLADDIRALHRSPIVLFLGRLAYYKGLDVLLRAMRSVDATLLLCGTGPKGAELQAMAADLGVSGRVVFVGDVGDAERLAYYHAADVFAFPSTMRAEAFGIAMLQAMACGTPVISTELGTGTSWVNQDGQTGLVVPAGDVAALATALNDVIGGGERRRAMGEAAAERVAQHFTRAQMFDALGALYGSVVR
jgi:glycosyltransferase involved in cell wall biosynthesis